MTNQTESSHTIVDAAAEWVARIDRSGDDPNVRASLEQWLDGDQRRRGAFIRAQAAWQMLDRASVLGRLDGANHVVPHGSQRRVKPITKAVAAIAASLVLMLASAVLLHAPGTRIETAIGEVRQVPLEDGSMAAINTATTLAVRFEPKLRRVSIKDGEAWFQVAKNAGRPFIVEAGDVRVRAIGTAFSVVRKPYGADVNVTEGTVEVWSAKNQSNRRLIAAGSRATVSEDAGPGLPIEDSADIARNLAWREGQLIFQGDTLAAAASQFNRYNVRKVRIENSALGSERVVGRFRINEPEAFARAAAGMLDAYAKADGDEIVISRN